MKKYLRILLLLILFIPSYVYALDYPKVNSKIVQIYDLTDKQVLYEYNSKDKTSIASLTKIATTITAIENISDLDQEITITQEMLDTVAWDASIAGLEVNNKLTYKDLLYASMLPSGADATNSIAISTSQTIENFVKKMNKLAKKIGLNNTNFTNVTGLDDANHYSNADDIKKLLEYSLNNPTFKEIFTTKEYEMSNGKVVKSTLYKYKASESTLERIIGSKTGFTQNAGYCLATLSNVNGHDILTIVIKSNYTNNKYNNIEDTITLLDFMTDNYKEVTLVNNNQLIRTIDVNLSDIEEYNIYTDKEITKYLPIDHDVNNLKIEYDGLQEISYKNKINEKIGTIKYTYNDELLYEQDIILNTKININIIKVLKKHIVLIIIITILLTTSIIIYIKIKKR